MTGHFELRRRPLDGDAIGFRIDAQQHLSRLDAGIVADAELGHPARDLRRNLHDIGLDRRLRDEHLETGKASSCEIASSAFQGKINLI